MELGKAYRDDDNLKKGEAQVYQLQQQVDELRRFMREQIARQHSIEESSKQNEARILQMREVIDKMGAEVAQTLQIRGMEEHRIKQELADLQVRMIEPIKAIRELRSQLVEVAEMRRKDTEQTGLEKNNTDKLQIAIRDTQGQISRLDGAIRDLREAIKITANAQEFYQRELERILDIIHNNEQLIRRQTEDYREGIKDLRGEVQLFANRITRLEDLQRQDSARIEEIPPVFDVLRQEDERVLQNTVRVERQMSERLQVLQERLEEIRQQAEGQFFSLNQVITGQTDSQSTRFQALDDRIRSLDGALLDIQMRIEQVKQISDTEIYELYQRDEQRISRQLEYVQSEFDMMRQQRARSNVGGLAGRRANKARTKTKGEEEGATPGNKDTNDADSSI